MSGQNGLIRLPGRAGPVGQPGRLPTLPGWLRGMLAAALREQDAEIARYKEALDGYEETRHRLEITQRALICLLEQQGGRVTLSAGQLSLVPPGSVVGVQKLEPGEGDSVRLLIYWRPPGGPPPETDYASPR